jgi:hypothetical protein
MSRRGVTFSVVQGAKSGSSMINQEKGNTPFSHNPCLYALLSLLACTCHCHFKIKLGKSYPMAFPLALSVYTLTCIRIRGGEIHSFSHLHIDFTRIQIPKILCGLGFDMGGHWPRMVVIGQKGNSITPILYFWSGRPFKLLLLSALLARSGPFILTNNLKKIK